MNREQPVSLAVVEAVAEREGIPAEKLEPPLHDAIQTDALDALFDPVDSDRLPASLEFTYNGYVVSVEGSGGVSLEAVDGKDANRTDPRPNDVPYC
ncbi:HalOD1 output domain-containing protein [Natrialba sp. INN-245]|uniref:HalOD1 output domain-containing protein n=1 Tax=Natrialba sp. INN-245 TaxID=2690967 RepID=UPI001F30186C|nr:HalOD1 output domain-containing protein [Natrialba sp. INN-245]